MKIQPAQNKTVSAEKANQGFFETYDEIEENREQQRLLLKPKFFEIFDNDNNRMLKKNCIILGLVIDKMPSLQDIEIFGSEFVDCRKDTLRAYIVMDASNPVLNELSILEKRLQQKT